ncbi:hypothetical protein [Streptomyces spiramenti]|uniref:Uncharacterized protein n=1 Tax=Streptomyces spiramenti TaxID=2720606 RepID=A0ABX1ALX8_9ACTN|nr:hypothetical protein [Streptomyces spiramenti]NJP66701.1 hypothetical protein [Streptomyces spiramenti]
MEAVPTGTPGRALTDVQLFAHTALPRVDGAADEENAAGLEEAVRRVRESWTGEPVRAVRVLPPRLAASALPAFEGGSAVPFAVREDLTAVGLDLAGHDQHFIVLGDSECGKTNLLRLVADGLMERYSNEELVFAVSEYGDVLPLTGLSGDRPQSGSRW